jgi:pimeloyl-ACP methyl ester carboxylesterase
MVTWDHVTRADVLRAIKDYDRLGPERHGFAPTTTYELAWEGRRYPPKAILGTAYEFATCQRLGSSDFEGGKQWSDLASRRSLRVRFRAECISGRAVQRPISLSCITVPVGRPLWRDIPSWFLLAEEDRMIVPETQRHMASRMKATIKAHAADHIPSVTAPMAVVDIIRDAIGSVTGR